MKTLEDKRKWSEVEDKPENIKALPTHIVLNTKQNEQCQAEKVDAEGCGYKQDIFYKRVIGLHYLNIRHVLISATPISDRNIKLKTSTFFCSSYGNMAK